MGPISSQNIDQQLQKYPIAIGFREMLSIGALHAHIIWVEQSGIYLVVYIYIKVANIVYITIVYSLGIEILVMGGFSKNLLPVRYQTILIFLEFEPMKWFAMQ